jgi:hypothetical protein
MVWTFRKKSEGLPEHNVHSSALSAQITVRPAIEARKIVATLGLVRWNATVESIGPMAASSIHVHFRLIFQWHRDMHSLRSICARGQNRPRA